MPYVLGAVALLLAFTVGYGLAVHRLTGRIEAMHAAMTATRADTGPHRRQLAADHLAAWRGAVRRWVLLHLHWGRVA